MQRLVVNYRQDRDSYSGVCTRKLWQIALSVSLSLSLSLYLSLFLPPVHLSISPIIHYPGNDDYEPTTETLTFTSSTRLVQVTVPIIDDDDVEGTEMFRSSLRVDTSRFPVTLSPDTSDIIILDNDGMIIHYYGCL